MKYIVFFKKAEKLQYLRSSQRSKLDALLIVVIYGIHLHNV